MPVSRGTEEIQIESGQGIGKVDVTPKGRNARGLPEPRWRAKTGPVEPETGRVFPTRWPHAEGCLAGAIRRNRAPLLADCESVAQ